MSARALLSFALAPAFLASLAACGATGGAPQPGPPGDDSANHPPSVSIAQASVARDPASSIDPAAVSAAAASNNAFAFDLYARVLARQTTPGNLLTSPISASLALTMTYAGAQGQTATEMATALHLGSSASTIFDGQNGLSAALASRGTTALAAAHSLAGAGEQPAPSASDYQLQIVNSVWGEQTYPWAQPFLTTLAKSYGTGVYLEDFVNQWEPARQAINAWVSSETADKINGLLPAGALDPHTRMVLVNAVHLKLPWQSPFQTGLTANATFTKSDGTSVSAPFMNQTESLPYADDGKAQIVALPLVGQQISVVFALPHGDLATYEAGLTSIAPPSSSADVALSMPKFDFTSPTVSLADGLKAMGMVQAFDPSAAQFQGMCPNPPDGENLYVSDVLQKAMVAAQETGIEAAAATAVVMAGDAVAGGPGPVRVALDRPFVVAIVDAPTGAILFLGHIEDPTQAGSP
jgi:serpin B